MPAEPKNPVDSKDSKLDAFISGVIKVFTPKTDQNAQPKPAAPPALDATAQVDQSPKANEDKKQEIKQEKKKTEHRKTAPMRTFEKKIFQANLFGAEIVSRIHSSSDTNTTTVNLTTPTVLEQLPEMNFKLSKEILTTPRGNQKAVYKYHADGSGSKDDLRFEEQDLIAQEMRQFAQKIKDAKQKGQKPCLDAIWIGDFNVSPYEIKDKQVLVNPKFLTMLQRAFPGGVFNIGLPSYAVIKTRGALEEDGQDLGLSPLNQQSEEDGEKKDLKTRGALEEDGQDLGLSPLNHQSEKDGEKKDLKTRGALEEDGQDLGLSPLNHQSEKDGEKNFDAKTIVVHIKFNEDGETISNDPTKMVEDKIKNGIDIKRFDSDYTGLKDHPYALLEDEDIVYAAWGNMSTQGFKGFSKPADKYQEEALENGILKKSTVEAGVMAVREFALLLSQNFSPLLEQPAGEVKLDEKQAAVLAKVKRDFKVEKVRKVSVPFSKAFSHIMTSKRNALNLDGLENTWKELDKKRATADFTADDAAIMQALAPKLKAVADEIAAEKKMLEGLLIQTLTAWFATPEFLAMKKTLKTKFGDTPEDQAKIIKKMAANIYKATKSSIDPFLKDLDGQTTAGYMPCVNGIQAAFDNALVDELQAEASARLINAIHQSGKVGYLVETESYVAKECLFYEMADDALGIPLQPSEVKEEDIPIEYYNDIAARIAAKITDYYPDDPQNGKQVFVLHNDHLYYIHAEDHTYRWIPRPNTSKDLEEYNTLKSRCISGCTHALMTLHEGEELEMETAVEITDKKKIVFLKNTEENSWWIACADGNKPASLQEIKIDNEDIIRVLESELAKGKSAIKNMASLSKLNAFLADIHLNYACNEMNPKNANKLDFKDKDLIINVSGENVRGSKDEGYTKAFIGALTRIVGVDFEDEKDKLFQIDKELSKNSQLAKASQEAKLEPAKIHLPPAQEDVILTPRVDVKPINVVQSSPLEIRPTQVGEDEIFFDSLLAPVVNTPKATFTGSSSFTTSSVSFSNGTSSVSSSSSNVFAGPILGAELEENTLLLEGTVKKPKRSGVFRSPSAKGFSSPVELSPPSEPKTMTAKPMTLDVRQDEFKQLTPAPLSPVEFASQRKTSTKFANSPMHPEEIKQPLSRTLFGAPGNQPFEDETQNPWIDLDSDNSFHVHRTSAKRDESPVTFHESHFTEDDMADLTLTGVPSTTNKQPKRPQRIPSPMDDFPEITRFRETVKDLRARGFDREDIDQWKLEALTKFVEEFDRLDTKDLSNEDQRDIRHLCLHVANSIYNEKKKHLPFGEDLECIDPLVARLSTRPCTTKLCMGVALLILGCALLASLSLISLGIPVVAAAAAATVATYTTLSTTALVGIGVGGAILSGLSMLGLFRLTKPTFSDIAHCADDIQTERIAMELP